MHKLVAPLAGQLIVSCQAYPGEPMRNPETMAEIAQAVELGGASAVRAQGLDDIRLVKERIDIPVIGIWKDGREGVFITPTLKHALAVIEAGADIVAIDGTLRNRPDGLTLAETVEGIRAQYPEVAIMADCDSFDSGVAAAKAGVDIVGTTLAGYTPARPKTVGPDLDLIRELTEALPGHAVVAEGRVHTTADAKAARDSGAFAVVVGTAITHPTSITQWFRDALDVD